MPAAALACCASLSRSFLPRARYAGLEVSEYLCSRFGWTCGSIADFAPRSPFDLVICYDVLQYLPDAEAARAIANFGRGCRAALYVSALTTEDWRENCDQSRTDRAVHLRSGAWYRRRLKNAFRYVGFGVWLRKDVTAILWEMELPWRRLAAIRLSRIQATSAACTGSAGTEVRAGMIDQ